MQDYLLKQNRNTVYLLKCFKYCTQMLNFQPFKTTKLLYMPMNQNHFDELIYELGMMMNKKISVPIK